MTALKKGFTLIELLIVIAILGVLAVVVLVAINPVQQLARTRDAGRISSVQQLGHAMEAYFVSHDAVYPSALADLVTAGEINAVPGQVTNTLSSYCGGHVQGWCFDAGTDAFAVWSALEADSNFDAATCGTGPAFAAYLSASGQTCIVCAEPSAGDACP
jgi:prepilin-type N-terminal cleavage/methylation domain-containing protein